MRKLTGVDTVAMGVLQAVRRSDPNLVTPIGWPVIISRGSFNTSVNKCHVEIELPDLILSGQKFTMVTFLLSRSAVKNPASYIYEVASAVYILRDYPESGHRIMTSCRYVKNYFAADDDFVVPVDTEIAKEIELMQVSTRDLRHWITSHPLQTTLMSL